MDKIVLEACIDNEEAAKKFIERRVDRFETCSRLDKGGLTPTIELFNYIKTNSDIKQVVMIRTNENFSANIFEIMKMKKQIKDFKEIGADSFIFGFIKDDELDIKTLKKLIEAVGDKEYCFHMAIDKLGHYKKNIQILIDLGFKRVLLKGGNSPAINNMKKISELINLFSEKIEILVGGSVTKDNWKEIAEKTKANQFHGTKIA
ncbi:MAG: copper homeostasis protein CutC [Metamycoplasmataceae bacterium]